MSKQDYLAMVLVLACAVFALTVSPLLAAPPQLPPRPEPSPERAREPDAPPEREPRERSEREPLATPVPVGALIELRAQAVLTSTLVTIVQVQDRTGNWRDVEGWRAPFDLVENRIGKKVWWLAENQFGAGVYRWRVLDANGKVVGESQAFNLPNQPYQVFVSAVALMP